MTSLMRGVLHQNISLADYTSWRVGGIAEKLYLPIDLQDLTSFIQTIGKEEPIFFIGLGSNLLIRDQGISGTIIVTQGGLNQLTVVENNLVRVEAGVACATMARFCARNALGGIEFLAGIPGTIGGALAMNAGCHDGETWQYIEKVETVDRNGQHYIRSAKEYQVSYRSVTSPLPEWFVAGYFRLPPTAKEHSIEKIRLLLDRRFATQPINEPNCGSVFRNPPDDYAARLIEHCELKGFTIGGASVSAKHANFIINQGNATALDIETLINHVKTSVAEKFGIDLIREVHIVGY
jgi:UDP-N-acetylmuramate dehydrogenase